MGGLSSMACLSCAKITRRSKTTRLHGHSRSDTTACLRQLLHLGARRNDRLHMRGRMARAREREASDELEGIRNVPAGPPR